MGIVKGLTKIQETFDSQGGSGDKVRWFKIEDGQSVNVRILQELDEDSPGYTDEAGQGFLAVEHANPDLFRNKALCSIEEGACYGCEMAQERPKTGWHQKMRLYVNVLVDDGKEQYVAVLSQGNGGKSVTPALLEYANEYGTITNRWFKISRKGSKVSDTQYTLLGKDPSEFTLEDGFDLIDLDRCVREIPYEEQEAFYHKDWSKRDDAEPSKPKEDSWV